MVLLLKDAPGSLLDALAPISNHGGNIINVIHTREIGGETVPVTVIFEADDESILNRIKKDYKKVGIKIDKLDIEGRVYIERSAKTFILIGHVIDKGLREVIDDINEVGMASDVGVIMRDPKEYSSVSITVEVEKKKAGELDRIIEKICSTNGFMLIKPLNSK